MKLPQYAPLSVDYDQTALLEEINEACTPYLQNTALFRRPARKYHEEGKQHGLVVCSDDELEHLTLHYLNEHGERCEAKGDFNSWQTMNLTYRADDEDTKWINHRKIGDAQPTPLRELYEGEWIWREEIAEHIPVLKEIINSLQFEYLNQVRLLIMHPPSFAGLHIDSYVDTDFFDRGFTAITLNIASGGGDLVFLDGESHPAKADSNLKAWHFADNCIHGVTKCHLLRMQLRVVGKTTLEKYQSLMDMDKAIW